MISVSQSLLTLWKPPLKTLEYFIPFLDQHLPRNTILDLHLCIFKEPSAAACLMVYCLLKHQH